MWVNSNTQVATWGNLQEAFAIDNLFLQGN